MMFQSITICLPDNNQVLESHLKLKKWSKFHLPIVERKGTRDFQFIQCQSFGRQWTNLKVLNNGLLYRRNWPVAPTDAA